MSEIAVMVGLGVLNEEVSGSKLSHVVSRYTNLSLSLSLGLGGDVSR